jgi:hypothetical protein
VAEELMSELNRLATPKLRWTTPEVCELEAGEAEGSDGPGPDGGLAS